MPKKRGSKKAAKPAVTDDLLDEDDDILDDERGNGADDDIDGDDEDDAETRGEDEGEGEDEEEDDDDSFRAVEISAPKLTGEGQREALLKWTNEVTAEIRRMGKRRGGMSADEKQKIIVAMRKMQVELKTLRGTVGGDKRILGNQPGSLEGLFVPSMRLDPPKGMSRLHFNLIAQAPEEISYVGHMDRSWLRSGGLGIQAEKFADKYGMSEAWRGRMTELQWLNDTMIIGDMLLYGRGDTEYAQRSESRKRRLQGTRFWKDWASLTKDFQRAAGTALDTQTADQGLEWVPTLMSSQLQRRIEVELVVANLFRRIAMPSPTYDFPVMGADTIAYKVPENLEETGGASIPSRTFTTQKMQLTAVKLATRMMASSEIIEDSVISIVPIIIEQISKAIARAIDDCIINGDAAVTHQDLDVTTTTDARTSWDGLRNYALAYTNAAKQDAAAANPTVAKLLAMRGGMGVYGARPSAGVWLVGFESLLSMMQAADGGGNQVFLTLDKFGPGHVTMTGQLGVVLGSPVIMSEFMREDLDATGIYGAVGGNNVKGSIIWVNREAFVLGERRTLTIQRSSERYIERDQLVYVSTWRGDFKPFYVQPTEKVVGIVYNTP